MKCHFAKAEPIYSLCTKGMIFGHRYYQPIRSVLAVAVAIEASVGVGA
jgi:hypothetical protein